MAATADIDLLLGKLDIMQKLLGGPNEVRLEKMEKDEFNAVKYKLVENINLLTKKQEERDYKFKSEGRSTAVIKLAVDIQDLFMELESQLKQMKDTLRRQRKNPKKFPADQVDIKDQQFGKYTTLVNQLKTREEGDDVQIHDQPSTLAELKMNLLSKKGAMDSASVQRELNEIESDALKKFRQNDAEIDDMLNMATEGLDKLKNKAIMMNEELENQEEAVDELRIQIEKAQEGLTNANARLKKVLFHYRKPSKFCLDVFLILLLLALVGIIIKLVATKSSS